MIKTTITDVLISGVLAATFLTAIAFIFIDQYRYLEEQNFQANLGHITNANDPHGEDLDGKIVIYYDWTHPKNTLQDQEYNLSTNALIYRRFIEMKPSCTPSRYTGCPGFEWIYDENGEPLSKTFYNNPAFMGPYEIDAALLSDFGPYEVFLPKNVPYDLSQKYKNVKVRNNTIYIDYPKKWIWQYRFQFQKVVPGLYTVIAQVDGKTLKRPTNFGISRYAFRGKLTLEEALQSARSENEWLTFLRNTGAFVLLLISLMTSGNYLRNLFASLPALAFAQKLPKLSFVVLSAIIVNILTLSLSNDVT